MDTATCSDRDTETRIQTHLSPSLFDCTPTCFPMIYADNTLKLNRPYTLSKYDAKVLAMADSSSPLRMRFLFLNAMQTCRLRSGVSNHIQPWACWVNICNTFFTIRTCLSPPPGQISQIVSLNDHLLRYERILAPL